MKLVSSEGLKSLASHACGASSGRRFSVRRTRRSRNAARDFNSSIAFALALAFSLLGCAHAQKPAPPANAYVWWEGENPTKTNFSARHSFQPANETEAAVLSGGKWLGAEGKRGEALFAEYEIVVPSAGEWSLYARKFWKHGPFRWRFDKDNWQEVGKDPALLDDAPIRQFVGANWIGAGNVSLSSGKHTLRIELTESDGAAAFDCFCLTQGAFVARGKLKPGEKYGRTEPGWFAFEPDADTFAPTPLDLRYLNEKNAGDGGFIQSKGGRFVQGKTGKPVKFWAVNAGPDVSQMPASSAAYLARSLAKKGVNLVRLHGALWKDASWREIDPAKLDGLQRFVSALKKEGIYAELSIYFPLWLNLPENDSIAGYGPGKTPFSLLFFSPEFQSVYRGWWKAILTSPNPHGLPLGKDPAVAVAELCNEDSYLFWTFADNNIPEPQRVILEKQLGAWLAKKYGSLGSAMTAWNAPDPRDKPAEGRVAFRGIWDLANRKDVRSQDTAAFLTESQKNFFDGASRYLKKDLGFGACVVGSNWITGDGRVLGPLDKFSNAGLDAMDRHGYFGGRHEGPRAGYSLSTGDLYEDRSALLFTSDDFSLPLFDTKWAGLPSMVSEVNWPTPNRFRAEFPLLAASYGALQGTDAVHFFALGGADWNAMHGKFDVQVPTVFGQFPAAALIFRQGLVKTGPPAVALDLKRADLFALKGMPLAAPQNLDELRAADVPKDGSARTVKSLSTLDPLAFLVGPVTVAISEGGGPAKVADLPRQIDRTKKTARSLTGELAWNWGAGRAVISAPSVNAVSGFLSQAGKIALPAMTVESGLEYGAVTLISLDGKPLATSGKMLLQVMSEDRNWGWKTAPADKGLTRIESLGGPPLLVRNLTGAVTLARPDAKALKITALDGNGYPVAKVGTGPKIALRPETLYYLIEK